MISLVTRKHQQHNWLNKYSMKHNIRATQQFIRHSFSGRQMFNNLKDMRTYLVGAMDRVPDGGIGWRQAITPMLSELNIKVLNPCDKPIESAKEGPDTRTIIDYYKQTGQFDKIREEYGHIRNADLRCVDVSDFVIANIDMNVHMCGSYEEISTANRQRSQC